MRQLHQAQQGSVCGQATEKPLGITLFLSKGRLQAASLQVRSNCVYAFGCGEYKQCQGELQWRQIACARYPGCAFALLNCLPARLLGESSGDLADIMARRRTWFLGLTSLTLGQLARSSCRRFHLLEQTNTKIGGYSTDIRQAALVSGTQETGDTIACIGDNRTKRHFPSPCLIQKVQGQFWFGSKALCLRYAAVLTARAILCPVFWQIQARANWPIQGAALGRIVHDILGTDDQLAVPLLAQGPRVLMLNLHRRLALFWQVGVVEHQHAMS